LHPDAEVGRGGRRDYGDVVGALGQGGVEIGVGEGLGDSIALGDLGAAHGMGFTEGDRVAAVEVLEDTEMALADGAGADDEKSHEQSGGDPRGSCAESNPIQPRLATGEG
jgi:hypothetical protein